MDAIYIAIFAVMAGLTYALLDCAQPCLRETIMSWLYWLSGLTAAALFVYLLVALFKPEKF